jgi:hypothetical protein
LGNQAFVPYTADYYFSKKPHGNNQDFRAGVWRNRRG